MAGIGKQFKGSGIAKSGFSSKHEQARDHLKSGGLTPIGNLRIPRRVKGELNMLAEGGSASLKEVDKENNPGLAKLPTEVRHKMGYMKEGGSAKPGLWANINRRKKLGISRPKSKSTISPEAYKNMQHGFKKGGSSNWIQGAIKHPGALRASLHVKDGEKIPAKKLAAAAKKPGTLGRRARLAQTLRGFKK
jgi:hypothetical protein